MRRAGGPSLRTAADGDADDGGGGDANGDGDDDDGQRRGVHAVVGP